MSIRCGSGLAFALFVVGECFEDSQALVPIDTFLLQTSVDVTDDKDGRHHSLSLARSPSPQVDPSFNGKLPIEFVHVPKCGSSFLLTLLHIPGNCENLPQSDDEITATMNRFYVPSSWKCNSSVWDTESGRLAHADIEDLPKGGFESAKGRFMIMLRQPEQRLLSGMNYMTWGREPDDRDVEYYKETKSGRVTKMLTRSASNSKENPLCDHADRATRGEVRKRPSSSCNEDQPPTRDEVEMAKTRLQTGFSFIGITDQWDLSICLFNTMFNQPCRSFQFSNTRPTSGNNASLYDTTLLKGWHDPYDTEPYEVGKLIFEANLKTYNVSQSSCERCWREAGLL